MQLWILYNVTTRLHFYPNKAGISGLPSTAKRSWSFVAGGLGDNLLSTKEARNGWETEVSNTVITPQLKVKNSSDFVSCKRRRWENVPPYVQVLHFEFCHRSRHSTWIDSWRKSTRSSGPTLASPPIQSWSSCLVTLVSSWPHSLKRLWSIVPQCGAAGRRCLCSASRTM